MERETELGKTERKKPKSLKGYKHPIQAEHKVVLDMPPEYKEQVKASIQRVATKHESGYGRPPTERLNPGLVAKVIDLLVDGSGMTKVGRECGMSKETVKEIYKKHIDLIGGWRTYAVDRATETRERLYAVMNKKLDTIEENPELLDRERTTDIAKAIESMDRTILACNGMGSGVTVNVVNAGPSLGDVMKMQEEMRRKIEEKRAGAVSV